MAIPLRSEPPPPARAPAPPIDDCPRDRLLLRGPQALSDPELLAVLLTGGAGDAAALPAACDLLGALRGLVGLPAACPQSLHHCGLDPAQSASVLAAVEFSRRLAAATVPARDPLPRPSAVAHYLDLRYSRCDQEVMGALFLDSRGHLVGEEELFRGTLSRTAVEPRQILRRGLLYFAAQVLLFHTHPSGDPAPSREDLSFTERMRKAGELVGIRLTDHLIVAPGGQWVSLRQRGGW